MQQDTRSTLDVIYENWRGYNGKLQNCIAPLTNEQLLLQPAPRMWPLGQIVQHMISVRAGWFSGTLQDADDVMNEYMLWGQRDSPERSAVELARGLDETWTFIESRLQRWTPADCAKTFPDEWDGQTYEASQGEPADGRSAMSSLIILADFEPGDHAPAEPPADSQRPGCSIGTPERLANDGTSHAHCIWPWSCGAVTTAVAVLCCQQAPFCRPMIPLSVQRQSQPVLSL